MKYIVFCIMMMLTFGATAQSYTKVNSNTFKATKVERSKGDTIVYHPTTSYWIAANGKKYLIHTRVITRGENKGKTACYVYRVSKSGNGRWEKIDVKPEELSKS